MTRSSTTPSPAVKVQQKGEQNDRRQQGSRQQPAARGGSLASDAVMRHVPRPASFNLSHGITSVTNNRHQPLLRGGKLNESTEDNQKKAKDIQSILKLSKKDTEKKTLLSGASKSKSSAKPKNNDENKSKSSAKTKKNGENKSKSTPSKKATRPPRTIVPLDKHGVKGQRGGGLFQLYSGLDKAPTFQAQSRSSLSELSGHATAHVLETPGAVLGGRISDYAHFPPVAGVKPQFYLPTTPSQVPPPHELTTTMSGGGKTTDSKHFKNLLS